MNQPRLCPACDEVPMLYCIDEDTALEIDSCPSCFGLWFDGEELRQFFPSTRLAERVLKKDASSPPEPARAPGPQERLCPACGMPMTPSPVGAVTLDCCYRCRGIWFDHGELQRIVEEYRAGRRGNLIVLNQLAEGLRAAEAHRRSQSSVRAARWLLTEES
ncbi:MAG: zf-TFIIB domain-containing protein [Armatimonadetes bacterium]|nr:zf-TFIIB domain-containing protein [Armatimonadota bacterium]